MRETKIKCNSTVKNKLTNRFKYFKKMKNFKNQCNALRNILDCTIKIFGERAYKNA